jgi:hypothetical protein
LARLKATLHSGVVLLFGVGAELGCVEAYFSASIFVTNLFAIIASPKMAP